MLSPSVISDVISSLVALEQGNIEKSEKRMMRIVDTDEENFNIFWTTRSISMKFSRKMWLMITLKVIPHL